MMKNCRENIHIELPKNKRFHRVFSVRLAWCMLAGMIGSVVLFQADYKKDSKLFTSEMQSNWEKTITELSAVKKNGSTVGDDLVRRTGVQHFTNSLQLTMRDHSDIYKYADYLDNAVILMRSDDTEYYISENEVIFLIRNSDSEIETFYANPELTEQIAASYQKDSRFINAMQTILSRTWLYEHTGLREQIDKSASYRSTPFYIALEGDRVCKAEIGWQNENRVIRDLRTFGTNPSDECTEYRNSSFKQTSDGYQYIDTNPAENLPYLFSMGLNGTAPDSDSYQIVHKIAADLESFDEIKEEAAELEEIIADTSGKKREAYLRDQNEDAGGQDEIKSPEEHLKKLINRYTDLPANLSSRYHEELPFYYGSMTHNFYNANVCRFEIDGEKWILHHFEHLYYLPYKMPEYVVTCIHMFLAVLLIASVWAAAAFLRSRKKFDAETSQNSL